ncbi:winged helix-turn-helix transcriptional regulator [Candidatus Woesearchaeota archaeon]|nr:winged helix-turn-helix transcriptional regulator [Candidatus Woesearchaeota archaeon]
MSKKRDRIQVIYDILNAVKEKDGKIKPTNILYKANLSPQMLNEYLKELIGKGLIKENNAKDGKTYSLENKGFEFLSKYKTIVDFLETFGLN